MSPIDAISCGLLGLGCFIILSAGWGVLRMPDFFTRMHPAGKNDSLAQLLVLGGLALQSGLSIVTVKLALIALFLLITTPSSTHAVARAAIADGKEPWRNDDAEGERS